MRGYEEITDRLRRSSVQVVDGGGGGAGVVWDARGLVVTNAHVVHRSRVTILDSSGRRAEGRVTRQDREQDLALVDVGQPLSEPAQIGDSDSVRTGQIVIAIGNPLGVAGAVTAGMVHAIGPLDAGAPPFMQQRDWIQADVHLAPGNSGGLLADAEGRVIGINTMIFRGIGLAVPSNDVREFVTGVSERVRLGVELIAVPQGLMVVGIEQGGIAELAGIRVGDILACGAPELRRLLGKVKRLGTADIPVTRGGVNRILRVHTSLAAGARAA
jgi:serine protease Do